MAYNNLTQSEAFVYEWQKDWSGSFRSGLAELICKADLGNQLLLSQIYPDEVAGIQKFQNEAGWWETVQNKAKA